MPEIYKGFHIMRAFDGGWGIYDCGKIIGRTRTKFGAKARIRRMLGQPWIGWWA